MNHCLCVHRVLPGRLTRPRARVRLRADSPAARARRHEPVREVWPNPSRTAEPDAAVNRQSSEDSGVLLRLARGDADAAQETIRVFGGLVWSIALRFTHERADAEDAVQEAFIRALERIDQLSDGSPFGPWFYRVLRSTCLNLLRREKLRDHEEIPHDASGERNPEQETDRRLTRQKVLAAMEELPEMQRTAVTLYDLEGYSHREIADILDVAEGTSRAHVHHGRKALREILGDEGEDDDERREEQS